MQSGRLGVMQSSDYIMTSKTYNHICIVYIQPSVFYSDYLDRNIMCLHLSLAAYLFAARMYKECI